jgi:hypothetical protein
MCCTAYAVKHIFETKFGFCFAQTGCDLATDGGDCAAALKGVNPKNVAKE